MMLWKLYGYLIFLFHTILVVLPYFIFSKQEREEMKPNGYGTAQKTLILLLPIYTKFLGWW